MAKKTKKTAATNQKKQTLTGPAIFHDKHGQTIYFNKKSGIGYVVPESDFGKFQLLQMRYMLALVVAVLIYSITQIPYWLGGIIFIAVALFCEFTLRFRVLPTYTQYPNFVPEKGQTKLDLMEKEGMKKSILRIALLVIAGILFILLIVTEPDRDMTYKVICVLASIVCFAYALIQTYNVIQIKNRNK